MATKTICDRCGKDCYPKFTIELTKIQEKNFFEQFGLYRIGYDLCEECKNELEEWIGKKEE